MVSAHSGALLQAVRQERHHEGEEVHEDDIRILYVPLG